MRGSGWGWGRIIRRGKGTGGLRPTLFARGVTLSGAAETTGTAGRSAMRKAFRRILPLILLAYLMANMDRSNVGFAAARMSEDLKFSASVYGLGAGLFFAGYALFQIPSNLVLVRVGARVWIACIMAIWGVISASMMFVHGAGTFYALRFLLGVAEAGFFPGVITYLSLWFPPCRRFRPTPWLFACSSLPP